MAVNGQEGGDAMCTDEVGGVDGHKNRGGDRVFRWKGVEYLDGNIVVDVKRLERTMNSAAEDSVGEWAGMKGVADFEFSMSETSSSGTTNSSCHIGLRSPFFVCVLPTTTSSIVTRAYYVVENRARRSVSEDGQACAAVSRGTGNAARTGAAGMRQACT